MGREDERFGFDRHGGVCAYSDVHTLISVDLMCYCRMSVGLGMTREEWDDLKAKVDDSFWVMRIIGNVFSPQK